jgi:hypothetical protein
MMPLSPVDHIFVGRDAYAIAFLLYLAEPLEPRRLERALAQTVRKFWPVGARLVAPTETPTVAPLAFASSRASLDFAELPARATLPDFTDPAALAEFAGPAASEPGLPLASFRLARVGAGSVFVATLSHAVVDGYSYFFFLSTLAALYRRELTSLGYWQRRLLRPDLDRRQLRPRIAVTAAAAAPLDPENFYSRTGITLAEERRMPPLADSRWEFVRFARSELEAALAAARLATGEKLSAHDLISARLWKKIAAEWHDHDEALEISSAFDIRRTHPAMSARYFGNAIRATVLRLSRAEVLECPVARLAQRIRGATRALTPAAVQDALACMEETRVAHGAGVFQRMHVSHPHRGFLVTNLSRVPLAALDFGSGPPRRLVPLTPAPRSAIVLADGDGLVARLGLPNAGTNPASAIK